MIGAALTILTGVEACELISTYGSIDVDNKSPTNRIHLTRDTYYQPKSEPAGERWIGNNQSPTARQLNDHR